MVLWLGRRERRCMTCDQTRDSEQLSYLDDAIAAPPTLEATKKILKGVDRP